MEWGLRLNKKTKESKLRTSFHFSLLPHWIQCDQSSSFTATVDYAPSTELWTKINESFLKLFFCKIGCHSK